MGMIGTFDSFTTARLGIYAAQHGLRVTGNNISNINTVGYTRQRLDQVSLKTGANDMYRSIYDNHIGNGALVTGINQIRDPYLDIQFRDTNSQVGYTDEWLRGLQNIARTLDEVAKGFDTNRTEEGDGILYAQLLDLRDMLMQLSNNPDSANDTLVRNSAQNICQLFNTYANSLETLRKETEDNYDKELTNVNEILNNIRDLNEAIRKADICGDPALELRDQRNLQIDALSEYMAIRVEYSMEDIGAGREVEKLTISLGGANPDPSVHTDEVVLIDGIFGSQIESTNGVYVQNPNFGKTPADTDKYLKPDGTTTDDPDEAATKDYVLSVTRLVSAQGRIPPDNNVVNADRPITLHDNDMCGSLQAMRELLTEKGEFSTVADVSGVDPNSISKRGIPYYQLSLDLLARQFAESFNALNQGAMVDQNGNVIYKEQIGTPDELGLKLLSQKELDKSDADGLSGVDGYYVDSNGYYVGKTTGTHAGGECLLTKAQINSADSLETAIQKIYEASPDSVTLFSTNLVGADGKLKFDGAGGKAFSDAQKAEAKAVLDKFMADHGVTENDVNAATGELNDPVYATISPEGAGVLFSNRNDGDKTGNPDNPNDPDNPAITAANISISYSWLKNSVKVVPTFTQLFGGDIQDSTQQADSNRMISLIDKSLLYNPKDLDPNAASSKLFEGCFNDMFSNMESKLANDQGRFNVQLTAYYTTLVDTDTNRDGVSGVDLNDEAMNIMMYQKAYSAACRLMTAIDEAIDRLINNTGIAGR